MTLVDVRPALSRHLAAGYPGSVPGQFPAKPPMQFGPPRPQFPPQPGQMPPQLPPGQQQRFPPPTGQGPPLPMRPPGPPLPGHNMPGQTPPVPMVNQIPGQQPLMHPPQGSTSMSNTGHHPQMPPNIPQQNLVNGVHSSPQFPTTAAGFAPPMQLRQPGPPLTNGPVNGVAPPQSNVPRSIGPPPLPGQRYAPPGSFPPRPPHRDGQIPPPNMNAGPQVQGLPSQNMQPPMSSPAGGLPVPFHGQAHYSHQLGTQHSSSSHSLTPTNSEPTSRHSSRAPSPVAGTKYDALEGQFPSSPPGQQRLFPAEGAGSPVLVPNSGPPLPGQNTRLQPPQTMPSNSMAPNSMAPVQPPTSAGPPVGIVGRRVYPNMPSQGGYGNSQPVINQPTMNQPAVNQPAMNQAVPGYTGGMPPYQNTGPGMGHPPAPNQFSNMPPNSNLSGSFNRMNLQQQTEGRPVNLLQERNLIPPGGVPDQRPNLQHDFKKANCSTDLFRCTLSTLPNSQSLLNQCRLPLGILIHPFKDLSQLPVIQSSVIVRCRSCRTYINPFVSFVDMRRWKCNLCYRVNELPDEFNFDPVSKTYGEPQRRPEIRSATIEFIAPSEYMLRPPQPAVYLYVLDVSFNAVSTGYLQVLCQTILDELDQIPGDARTQIGFITFDSSLHFYNLDEGLSQPQMLVVSDVDDVFLPSPDNLLVNLSESKELVADLLTQLPTMFQNTTETGNALGAALQAAYKMMSPTGGRISVFQTLLPNVGPGALKNREDPNERAGKNIQHLGPATDFYKKLALECSAQQIAVDLFALAGQYCDMASVACISKYSGGSIHYFPGLHVVNNVPEVDRFEGVVRRYLTRKIGFESVMRIRCTRGLSIHTFHGNFFVRSTDLLSLPNINPDAAFGMQMSIEDTLESNTACFQAALLYTSSKGERRIRVHTMCLPVTNQLSEVYNGADQKAIIGLLSKMAVDRSISSSLGDARDAMIYAAVDMLKAYGGTLHQSQRMGQVASAYQTRLMPLFISAMLKYYGFRVGSSTRLDERVFAMEQMKTLPLCFLLQELYPNMYPVHALDDQNAINKNDVVIPQPGLLQLSAAHLDRHGAYILDNGSHLILWVGAAVSDAFCQHVFGVTNFSAVPDGQNELPELENAVSERLRIFLQYLQDQRPFPASFHVIREDSRNRGMFLQHLVEDRTESTMSYYEFLQYLQKELKF